MVVEEVGSEWVGMLKCTEGANTTPSPFLCTTAAVLIRMTTPLWVCTVQPITYPQPIAIPWRDCSFLGFGCLCGASRRQTTRDWRRVKGAAKEGHQVSSTVRTLVHSGTPASPSPRLATLEGAYNSYHFQNPFQIYLVTQINMETYIFSY